MIETFHNLVVRSPEKAFGDLMACRQLRHMTDEERGKLSIDIMNNRVMPNGRKVSWLYLPDLFETAFKQHGFSCDICGTITDAKRPRIAANRALDNLDGYTKLFLCFHCGTKFKAFCFRQFDIDYSGMLFDNVVERMMLAYLAYRVRKEFDGRFHAKPSKAASS